MTRICQLHHSLGRNNSSCIIIYVLPSKKSMNKREKRQNKTQLNLIAPILKQFKFNTYTSFSLQNKLLKIFINFSGVLEPLSRLLGNKRVNTQKICLYSSLGLKMKILNHQNDSILNMISVPTGDFIQKCVFITENIDYVYLVLICLFLLLFPLLQETNKKKIATISVREFHLCFLRCLTVPGLTFSYLIILIYFYPCYQKML